MSSAGDRKRHHSCPGAAWDSPPRAVPGRDGAGQGVRSRLAQWGCWQVRAWPGGPGHATRSPCQPTPPLCLPALPGGGRAADRPQPRCLQRLYDQFIPVGKFGNQCNLIKS